MHVLDYGPKPCLESALCNDSACMSEYTPRIAASSAGGSASVVASESPRLQSGAERSRADLPRDRCPG